MAVPVHDDAQSLLLEFPAVSLETWRARVERELGRPASSLDAPSLEGPVLRSLEVADDREPGPRPAARAPGWSIALQYAERSPDALVLALRHDVARGLEVAWVELHDDLRAEAKVGGAGGGTVLEPGALPSLVAALGPEVALHLDAGLLAPAMARVLFELRGKDGPADAVLCDPLATLARTGGVGVALELAYARLAETTQNAARVRPSMRTILVDAVAVHDAGASAEQEVAYAIATGIEHLRQLEAHGLPPALAMPHLAVRMAVGTDLVVDVAKLRAVQRLWARVRAHAGAAEGPPTPLWARTSWRGSTRRDPWINLLRGSVAGFAAVLGGASVIAVQPFTEALGQPDDDARRLAINTQHILRGESYLGAVDDPTAGSWTFEAATDALAAGAWAQTQRWLALGGVAQALQAGILQAEVAERAAARSQALACGSAVSTGTSLYPLLDERTPTVGAATAVESPITARPAIAVRPLLHRRTAEPFEVLRDRSDRAVQAAVRPRAALVPLGDPRRARGQLDFARNFVMVGGFEALVSAVDAEHPEDVRLFILCAPPETLAEHGPQAARALLEGGARRVLVAGRPTEALREAGVHDFVHRGRDVVALLSALQSELLPLATEVQP